jgi:hypothetical protein
VHQEDWRAQVDKLQAEGFPPAIIRAILTAQVRESFAARRKALEGAENAAQYWLQPNRDPATQAALRALAREEQKILKDLLGPSPENSLAATLRRQVPELSEDKLDQIAQIRERYDEKRQDLYANVRGSILPDEREKMVALDKAMRNELASVLSPQDLESYELRVSNTANQLRYELTAFDPNEQEFRALFKLKSAFEEQFSGAVGPLAEDQRRARMDAQKVLDENIRAALGAQRYTEYQRATDYNYRTTSQLVARLELPPEATNQVWAVQQDFQQRTRTIPPAERAALATEAQAKLTAILTPRGYEAHKQYGGQWLQMLQPSRPAGGPADPTGVIRGAIQVSPGR